MRRICLLICAGLTLMGGPATARAQDSIKIGILTELSGPLGTLGMAERDGFLLYLKQAGGKLGGRTVETVIEDTGNDPATALAKVRKLVDSDNIDVLLGPMSSASAAAIKMFVSGHGLLCLVQATVDEVSDNKSMFRTTFPATADSFLQGYLAGKAGFKKAVAIAPNFNAGQDAVKWFEAGFEVSGGKVLQKLLPRLGTPDFGSIIAQIDAGADVGLIFMAGADAVRFIKQFADYGRKLPLYGFTATVDEAIMPAQGAAALGFVGASYYFSTVDTPENHAFVKDWEAAYKGKAYLAGRERLRHGTGSSRATYRRCARSTASSSQWCWGPLPNSFRRRDRRSFRAGWCCRSRRVARIEHAHSCGRAQARVRVKSG